MIRKYHEFFCKFGHILSTKEGSSVPIAFDSESIDKGLSVDFILMFAEVNY